MPAYFINIPFQSRPCHSCYWHTLQGVCSLFVSLQPRVFLAHLDTSQSTPLLSWWVYKVSSNAWWREHFITKPYCTVHPLIYFLKSLKMAVQLHIWMNERMSSVTVQMWRWDFDTVAGRFFPPLHHIRPSCQSKTQFAIKNRHTHNIEQL